MYISDFDHTEKYWDILTFWIWAIMLCFCKLAWIVKLLFQRVQEGAARLYCNSEALVFSSSFFHVKKLSVNDPKSHF